VRRGVGEHHRAITLAKAPIMGTDISLFSGYNQKENRTTNYCLLVLKLLYEENPKFLGEVLAGLVGEDLADVVGVQFHQQARKKTSVPDGVIVQQAFTLYIETKNWDWFSADQLEQHLAGLDREKPGPKVLIALSNFEALTRDRFAHIEALCSGAYEGRIYFKAVTFEEFVDALPAENVSKNLRDLIEEFEVYLDEHGLLPRWKTRLDVVNCAGRPADVTEGGVYICPATSGQYQHARAKYFGMYQGKAVRRLAHIDAVVRFDSEGVATLQWKNDETASDQQLLARAAERRAALRMGAAVRVFLLGQLFATDFKKTTSGGLRGNKLYFDVAELAPTDAEDLAAQLRGKSWADLRAR
jgi:hypothetical protein